MYTIIISVVAAIIAGVVTHFTPSWIAKMKESVPKRKRATTTVMLTLKYIPLAISTLLIIFFMSFDKPFVVSISCIVLLCSYFFARDILLYTFSSVTFTVEKENIEKDINIWLNQLAKCDREDEERQKMIIDKLNDLHSQRDLL